MTMETGILIVWAIGLLGALPPTLVILKEVTLVVRALSDIRELADRTALAAQGLSSHLEPMPALPAKLAAIDELAAASRRLSTAATALTGVLTEKVESSKVLRLGSWLLQWVRGRQS